ncbi:(R)-mandelonitrile lyase 1-like [Cucumis melo var. makuwa]|uniref:(R)-mandelonitrile lyase 1-like n=1 Tax=Cucumis melo var. makuwa TaxID=1194695 RepID=A0A5A7TUX8_CUCMM|nr:(R)-mandelonitrile lyase 1-like [Cucumis melo var. makuwa]
MDKGWMKLRDKFSVEYREGMSQFLEVAKYHIDDYKRTRCPCKRYSVYHEELVNLHKGIERFDEETSSNPFDKGTSNNHFHEENEISEQETISIFQELLNETRNEIYHGCSEFSFLNFLVKLIRIKYSGNLEFESWRCQYSGNLEFESSRCQYSGNLEFEIYVQKNGKIPISNALGAEKPIISLHDVRFSNTIGVLTQDTFTIHCLKWKDFPLEYIEVVKDSL